MRRLLTIECGKRTDYGTKYEKDLQDVLGLPEADDFPGADMARKFLQMGWTRARRYANHKGGRKYDKKSGELLPRTEDAEKAAAAAIFYERYVAARQHPEYVQLKKQHKAKHGSGGASETLWLT